MRVLPALAIAVICLTLPAVAGAATYTLKWNRPVLLENPNNGGALDSVACAPTATTLMCVAGDPKGNVWATKHPARAASGWRRQTIDAGNEITAVSCPSVSLCVAVDAAGQVMHSSAPDGGVKAWSRPARIDTAAQPGGGYAGFAAISCPTTKLCVAVDNSTNGQVAYTTDPTGPASAWTLATVGNGVTLDSVACASATMCVIGGGQRYVATNPTGGASAWKASGSLAGTSSVIAALACDTVKLCVGVGYGDSGVALATASSVPATGPWTGSLVGLDPPAVGAGLADGLACPERNFCVAVDGASNVYTSSTPVRGKWSAAKPLKPNSQATVSEVACNTKLCVEADDRGTVTYGVVKVSSAASATTK